MQGPGASENFLQYRLQQNTNGALLWLQPLHSLELEPWACITKNLAEYSEREGWGFCLSSRAEKFLEPEHSPFEALWSHSASPLEHSGSKKYITYILALELNI